VKKGVSLSKSDLQTYNKLREQVDKETFSEKTQLKTLKRQLITSQESMKRLLTEQSNKNIRKNELEADQEHLYSKKQKLEMNLNEQMQSLARSKEEMGKLESTRRRLNQLEIETNEKLDEIVNKLLEAKVDLQASHKTRKFKETIDNLKRLYPGVYGKLVDLCKPTQKKFSLAVSVLMGKNMDSVVVDSEKTAIECINYMKDQRCGQATFVPLDTISVKPVNEKYRGYVKGARLCIDVLQFESLYEKAVKYAVGNALISDDSDIAKYICYEKNQEVKIVTVDGTVFHKTGMITGTFN
jgi:structural maintenance of chromosome 1